MTDDAPIYLDYAATTPVDSVVAERMAAFLTADGCFANPASVHGPGRAAAAVVETARAQVAALIGAEPAEIVWTSGATEANNLAIQGAARLARERGRGDHLVTVRSEHRAVLAAVAALEAEGFRITYLTPAPDGLVDPASVAVALTERTALVSVMQVNNETGVVQNLDAIAAVVKTAGALLHVDAAQGAGRLALDVRELPVDLLSLASHKLYGPKGVGALYVRRRPRVRLRPLLHGGGHEGGLRSGTVPVHQVVAMGAAFELAARRREHDLEHLLRLHRRLREGLFALGGVVLNGRLDGCPHILNVGFAGVHGDALAAGLDGLAVSTGSACSAARPQPSHVLRAMGRPDALAHASLRLSLGRGSTEHEVDDAVQRIGEVVTRLRAFSPLWREYGQGRTLGEIYDSGVPLAAA